MPIAYGTGWSNNTASTSLTITVAPSARDFLVGIVCDDIGTGTITWPAGWVQLPTYSTVQDGASVSVAYLANATGAETSVTITGTNAIIGGITSFTGVDNGNPLDVPVVRSIADSAFPSPWLIDCGIQPANNGAMLVALMNSDGENLDAVHTFSDSGGLTWTTRLDLWDGSYWNVAIGTALQSTAAATLVTGTGTIATDVGAPSMTLFALRPSGATSTRAIPYVNVSAQGSTNAGGSTTSVTPGVTTAATGSTFLVFDQSTSSTGVTDSKGNTYSLIATVNGTGRSIHVWECANGVGGTGHTTTVAYSSSGSRTHSFVEVVGAGARDILASVNDTSSPFSLTTATLANQPQLVLFHASSDGAQLAETSGFQVLGRTEDGTAFWRDAWGQKRVTATTALTPSFTSTGATEGSLIVLSYQVGITFTSQPINQTTRQGSSATFTVGATGTGSLTYQWQDDSAGWANVTGGTGATTNTYTTATTTSDYDGRRYRCVVTAGDGTVRNSDEVRLDVNTAGTYADFDLDLRIHTWFDTDSLDIAWFDQDFIDVDGDVTTGWFTPITSAADAAGTVFSSLDSMRVSDDARATVTLASGATSEGFFVWGFNGLAVPSGKAIKGVEVRVEGAVTAGSIASSNFALINAATFTPNSVEIRSPALTGTEAFHILGTASDKWGGVDTDGGGLYDRDWTPADLNTSDFGVYGFFTAGGSGATVSLDNISLRVTYGAPNTVISVPVLAFAETLPVPKLNESVSVPALTFSETLPLPSITQPETIAVPALAFSEVLVVPSINETISVPAIDFSETLVVPSTNETIVVPALAFSETLPLPTTNQREVVAVPLVATTLTFVVPSINEAVSVPVIAFSETLAVPNINEVVAVPALAFSETLPLPVVNQREVVAVPVLAFAETLPLPVVNQREVVGAPALAFDATLPVPKVSEAVSVPALTFDETLSAPSVNEAVSVPSLAFTETLPVPSLTQPETVFVPPLAFSEALPLPNVNDAVAVPSLAFGETLPLPVVNQREVVAVPALAFAETLLTAGVNETVAVPALSFEGALPVPRLNETVSVPTLTFDEVLFAPSVRVDERLAVEALAFAETLLTPKLNETVAVPALVFTETVVVPALNETVRVDTAVYVQTLLVPVINQSEVVSVVPLTFAETLLVPTLMTLKVIGVTVAGNTLVSVTVLAAETLDVSVVGNAARDVTVT